MSLAYLKDLAERSVATFLEVYLAAYLVGDVVLNVFTFTWNGPELGIALGAAGLSVVKGLLAKLKGDPDSASLNSDG